MTRVAATAFAAVLAACGAKAVRPAAHGESDGGLDGGMADGRLGSPCHTDDDCVEGSCDATSQPGGYCVAACGPRLACPQGGVCASGACYRGCATPDVASTDCGRDGYLCTRTAAGNVCTPDCRVFPAACSGGTLACNACSGHCDDVGAATLGQKCGAAGACASGLECVSLGASAFCTKACGADADCAALPGATCGALHTVDCHGDHKLCDVPCDPASPACPAQTACTAADGGGAFCAPT